MKQIILIGLVMMSSWCLSQTPPQHETKVMVNKAGDTVLIMNIADARVILNDLLDKPFVDSLLTVYKQKDGLNQEVISIQKNQIGLLQQKSDNKDLQINNLNLIVLNKGTEITLKDGTIKSLKKEVKKQKVLKKLSLIALVVVPILVFITK